MSYKLIYVPYEHNLKCLNAETGYEVWNFSPNPYGRARTPAVDQKNGLVYVQIQGRLYKLNALTGHIINLSLNNNCLVASGNTILVNDAFGYHIITYWYKWEAYGGTLKCYNRDCVLEWEVTGLNSTQKLTPAYHNGIIYLPTGENYMQGQEYWYTGQLENCRVIAYNIADGSIAWTTILSDPIGKIFEPGGYGATNIIYCNGYLIVEKVAACLPTHFTIIYVLDATTGAILRQFDTGLSFGACGVPALSNGRLFTSDLVNDVIRCYQLGIGNQTDFAPYGKEQINTMEADDNALTVLDPAITFIGTVANGNQGTVVKGSVVFACYGTADIGVVSFNSATLAFIRQYATGNSYDSSPLIIANNAGDDYIFVHEDVNQRVICRRVDNGNLVWYSDATIPGNMLFGMTYFVIYRSSVIIFTAVNLAALKTLIDTWLLLGKTVIDIDINEAGTEAIIIFYI